MTLPENDFTASLEDIRAALKEWDRRFKEEPERWHAEAMVHFLVIPWNVPAAGCAYFGQILSEIREQKKTTKEP